MKTTEVVVVGAGPSGLATAACLNLLSVPTVVLERDDCLASLWRKRSYDRLHLHLHKMFCQLPHMPHPSTTPTFIPKKEFIQYMDDYASKFGVHPVFRSNVESASYTDEAGKWRVVTRNTESDEVVEYEARYLVVASGENDEMLLPEIPGLETFAGETLHSGHYRSGKAYEGKTMLVVGSGNSGMEIAYDLCNYGVKTSIVVRRPRQFLSREIWHLGAILSHYLPVGIVDTLVGFLCYLKFGDMSDKGITRPDKGPFYLKANTPTYPLIDVGAAQKIKSGELQVLPAIQSIDGNCVTFKDGKQYPFDGIVFATGYRCTTRKWLKDDSIIGEDGMTKHNYPNHWKGRNGVYCAGLVRRGLYGSSEDAQSIANDISADLKKNQGAKTS